MDLWGDANFSLPITCVIREVSILGILVTPASVKVRVDGSHRRVKRIFQNREKGRRHLENEQTKEENQW